MRGLALVGLAALLVLPAAATATVRVVSLTSPVAAGGYVTLTVQVAPANVVCSIAVTHKGVPSSATGLARKRARAGRVSWRWRMPSDAASGPWQIAVDCGKAGTLQTALVVKVNCLLDPGENPAMFSRHVKSTACVLAA